MAWKRAGAIYRQAETVMLEAPVRDRESPWGRRKSGQILGWPAQNNKTPRREEVEDIGTEGFGNDDVVEVMGC